ncbi:hypothetical protein BGW36DRAFT_429892 [Talaromyces proteolyticus]|uniref:Uncharacterized protein n=1 Tax=Talaromyces proteolyticus TaxID=1131652 RepID=A0AAD4PVT3_9EURO|nr:uncharacterized protein BGW36DRAFT_429892 [Talaromyces proteolyticus]KAH8693862.1 hypothetical protein BGW36DRAFT_429892 [Talaromyces proteolyticus]
MTLTKEEKTKLEETVRKYRIQFLGDVSQDEWPEGHYQTLKSIQELGIKQFDTYAVDSTLIDDEPWKLDVKRQAKQLVERAKRCPRRNESTWRSTCEPYVLARLTAEVVCMACRKRVWRAEIEASRDHVSNTAEALRARQRKREPCRCPRYARERDPIEAVGLNQIFGHREDEHIQYEKEILSAFPSIPKKPDAIFGLRHTRNIENLLNDTARIGTRKDQDGLLVQELLGPSPISKEGDSLSFPFLVLEAKSGRAGESDWYSIQLQSAFPVWTLLNTQKSLKTLTGNSSRGKTSPLVWLLMNRGEDWRVCAASIFNCGITGPAAVDTSYCRIFDLWAGTITSRNGALQLLLIVDHIFEWARDIYREDIKRELRVIASGDNDAASLISPDTDIHSTITLPRYEITNTSGTDGANSFIQGVKAFQDLDSSNGIVRHATFIETQYRCLLVTGDNADTLLRSNDTKSTRRLVRLVLKQLATEECLLLDSEKTLNEIEELWTGQSRILQRYQPGPTKLYALVTYAYYLMPDWQMVRELVVIAVAQDALVKLIEASDYKSRTTATLQPPVLSECNPDKLKDFITEIKISCPRDTLLSALLRVSETICSQESEVFLKRNDGMARDIVQYIYERFKRGQVEPQEPFLRASSFLDQTHLVDSETNPDNRYHDLEVSSHGCVLVYAESHKHDSGRARLSSIAAFFTDGPPQVPNMPFLGTAIKDAYENHDVYHTSRIFRPININALQKRGRIRWNIVDSYGIYSNGFEFVDWIRTLGCDPPLRQGSLRDSSLSIFSRCLFPFHEPGYIYGNRHIRAFIIYKNVSREIQYWRSIAQDRFDEGIICCELCGGDECLEDLCEICSRGLIFSKLRSLNWFRKAIQGQQAIDHVPFHDFGNWQAGQERLGFDSHGGDVNDEFESALSIYEDLDEDFDDLLQLKIQTMKFLNLYDRIRWPRTNIQESGDGTSSRKRKRTLSVTSGDSA